MRPKNTRMGVAKRAICVADPMLVIRLKSILFLYARVTPTTCSARLPINGMMMMPMNSSLIPSASTVGSRALTRISLVTVRAAAAASRITSARRQLHCATSSSASAARAVRRGQEEVHLSAVGDQQQDRDADRQALDLEERGVARVGLGTAPDDEREGGGDDQSDRRQDQGGGVHADHLLVVLLHPVLQAADEQRGAEDEQQVADDRAGDRRVDDVDLAVEDQERGDDDLADVADRGVHDPADLRSGRDAQLLGGVAEEVGEGEDRERGDAEGEGRIGVQDPQCEGRDRPDRGDDECGDQHRRMVPGEVVEMRGLEPLTPAMRTRCSPS